MPRDHQRARRLLFLRLAHGELFLFGSSQKQTNFLGRKTETAPNRRQQLFPGYLVKQASTISGHGLFLLDILHEVRVRTEIGPFQMVKVGFRARHENDKRCQEFRRIEFELSCSCKRGTQSVGVRELRKRYTHLRTSKLQRLIHSLVLP